MIPVRSPRDWDLRQLLGRAVSDMQARLKHLEKTFNGLLVRERLLIACSLVAALYMIVELAFLGPAQRKYTQLTADIQTQKKQYESLKAEEMVLTKVLTTEPGIKLKKEYEQLSAQLDALDKEIVELSAGLVATGQLAAMLQEVLVLTDGLQLQGLTTELPVTIPLPGDVLAASEKPVKPTAQSVGHLRLYKQYVSLSLTGNYFQILNYLKRLEATRWKFYWDRLFYTVDGHPLATVEIRVYSLSVERPAHE